MKQDGTLPEMQDLAEQIGEFIHYWGFKRVHGRIWTHLYVAQKPLDAADLVRQMKISKALVSISLRELLDFEVIEEVGKSSRGTHLYRTNPDILKVILSVLRQREQRILSRIHGAQESLEKTSKEDQAAHGMSAKNISQLGELVQKATIGLECFIALKAVDFGEWRQAFITTDLEQEAELRSRSIATPSSRKKETLEEAQIQTSVANAAAETPATGATKTDAAPILSSGQGIGFRIY